VITLTAGTTFIMWLGEQITERGIGNGMSLLIFTRASWWACRAASPI
jgi:preprotein translocase subunit SecY